MSRESQEGFTLVELLMGIILSSIFALALFGFFFSGVDSVRSSESQARAQADGRTAIDRLVREARQAISPDGGLSAPIIFLSPTKIEMYVDPSRAEGDTTPRPQRVRYEIVANQLVRQVADPVGATAPFTYGAYGRTEVLLEKLVNGVVPAFAASTKGGTAQPSTPSALQLRETAQISIRLLVGQKTGNSASTLELTTDVSLRNAITI